MSEDERELAAWLALRRTPGLGATGLVRLVEALGSARAALTADRRSLESAGLSPETAAAVAAASDEDAAPDLRWLEGEHRHILTLRDPRYPPRLRQIPQAPPLLFVAGDPGLLGDPQLAIVGSRHPTPAGRQTAQEFARHLASAGLTITSGLAMGIDAAAHEGALAAGGATIAVAGTGPDRVYPARNRALARRIAETGAVISEFPVGTPARPEHFPRRNRIISGLSLGTLVVEAARRSGSLITARLAGEQGREVFAIPGSIHNPLARGCHALIREGAKLVETAEDILMELRDIIGPLPVPEPPQATQGPQPPEDPAYQALLEAMGWEPVGVDSLVQRTGLTPEAVSSMLLILELRDCVASMSGGAYLRLKPREEDERERP